MSDYLWIEDGRILVDRNSGVQTGAPALFGIPASVVKKADALANRLTKEIPA